MDLAHFPEDVFRCLLNLPSASHAVVKLWQCGNRAFNEKLKNWIHTVHLYDDKRFSTSRWPMMLASLPNLRALRIERKGVLAPPSLLSQEVQKLPNALEELEIRCNVPLTAVVDFASIPALLAVAEGSSLSEGEPELYRAPFRNLEVTAWDMNAKFPELRKLVLLPWGSDSGYPSSFQSPWHQFFKLLPHKLEHLGLFAGLGFSNQVSDMLINCPTLRTLDRLYTSVPNVPTTLEHITTTGYLLPPKGTTSQFFKDRPNLKTVALRTEDADIAFPAECSLRTLRILEGVPQLRVNFMTSLPSTLTHLSTTFLVNIDVLKSLPQSIRKLESIKFDWKSLLEYIDASPDWEKAYKSMWPSSLRHLALSGTGDVLPNNAMIAYFPASLEHLSSLRVENNSKPFSFAWNYNMPKLSELQLWCGDVSFPNGITNSMTSLTLSCWCRALQSLSCFATSSITTLRLLLQSQDAEETFSHTEFVQILPKKLEVLDLNFNSCELDWNTGAWSGLPDTLKSFELTSVAHEGEINGNAWTWSLYGKDVLPYLPASLKVLIISLVDIKARDILAMPCYHNLREFRVDCASEEMPFTPFDDVVEAWPDAAESDSGNNWDVDNDCLFYTKQRAIGERAWKFPDPRTINPKGQLDFRRRGKPRNGFSGSGTSVDYIGGSEVEYDFVDSEDGDYEEDEEDEED